MSASPPTNLPDPSYTAVLTCYVSREIDAPLETVWEVLTDFTKYPEWNPFVRSQQITDQTGKTVLEDQTPAKGKYLLMKTHIPPTMDDSVRTQSAFESIIAYDDVTYRMAWTSLIPQWIVKAERWQALSTTEDGKTFYESREIFAGFGAYLIKWFISTNLMKGFEGMADAVQTWSEQQ
ncbi:hypothetical protein LXA43DRAFT_556036 [Ganoderma leucocontextum]|nr:hypothetical protein LXA43DRAFT_556036 [Ganoderma leucocontextum]